VQNSRKEMGLSVTDRIRLTVHGSDTLKEAWNSFGSTAAGETLAVETLWAKVEGQISLESGGDTWYVKIETAANE
jgi:hypothetical protein